MLVGMRISNVTLALSLMFAIVPLAKPQDSPDVLPKVVQHSQPIYPPLARQTRIQGDVRVRLVTDGASVTNVEAVAGHPLLRKATEDNVRTWKFASHRPSSFFVTFRYKLVSGDVVDVEFLEAPAVVQIGASSPEVIIDYSWIGLGTWKTQLTSNHGKSRRTLVLSYSGPHGEWLVGRFLGENNGDEEDDEASDFGHREGDFVVFTTKLRQPDGKQMQTFFVGSLKGNRIIGTFVDNAGVTGKWTAIQLSNDAKSR